jgi:hypothetical protein
MALKNAKRLDCDALASLCPPTQAENKNGFEDKDEAD